MKQRQNKIKQKSPIKNSLNGQYAQLMNLFQEGSRVSSINNSRNSSLEKKPRINHKKQNQINIDDMNALFEQNVEDNNVQSIGMFIQDLTMNPNILSELVDYKFLAQNLQKQINKQKERERMLVLQKQAQIKKKNIIFSKQVHQKCQIIKQQMSKKDEQIKSIRKLIEKLKQKKKIKQNIFKQKQQIINAQHKHKKKLQITTILELNSSIDFYKEDSNKIASKIRQLIGKMEKFRKKQKRNSESKQKNKGLMTMIEKKRHNLSQLQNIQNQQLNKISENQQKQTNNIKNLIKTYVQEVQHNFSTIKGVKDIEKHFRKINLAKNLSIYKNKQIQGEKVNRSKHSSQNTQPEEQQNNQLLKLQQIDIVQIEEQMKKMENSNPKLKYIRKIPLKSINLQKDVLQNDISNNLNETFRSKIQNTQKVALKLVKEQQEKQEFITNLKEKLNKIEEQLVMGTVLKLGIQKSMSLSSQ